MTSSLLYETNPEWPDLAWVAEIRHGSEQISVQCGKRVEQRSDWFCEAAWDGPFESGGFDDTDIIAGSGGRARDGKFVFVSSGSILDRLNYIDTGDRILVSNSLSALIALTDAKLDVTYPHYQQDLGTVCDGLENIKNHIETSAGVIRLVYFDNLAWNGERLGVKPKPRPTRDFSSYSSYRQFMQSSMQAVVDNASDTGRRHSLKPLVPMSNGYDSPTVAVLAREAGVKNAFTIALDRNGDNDSGAPIAEALGFDVRVIARNAWRQADSPEIDCIAGSGATGEVAFCGLHEDLYGCLLLSGFWGGAPWDRWPPPIETTFPDHDGSGLCFTELRLRRGFVHCPVPFWGGLQIEDLVKISQSEEMRPWTVPGRYDRPICRRIVEEAGIPRGSFATAKHGSSDQLLTPTNFLPPQSSSSYLAWLTDNTSAWWRKGRIPPYPALGRVLDGILVYGMLPVIRRVLIPACRRLAMTNFVSKLRKKVEYLRQAPLFTRRYTFPWALEISSRKYRNETP